jgi:hypothetical protein
VDQLFPDRPLNRVEDSDPSRVQETKEEGRAYSPLQPEFLDFLATILHEPGLDRPEIFEMSSSGTGTGTGSGSMGSSSYYSSEISSCGIGGSCGDCGCGDCGGGC